MNLSIRNHLTHCDTGFSGYLGLDLIKPVSSRLSLFAEPYFRFQPHNWNCGVPSTQRINTAGIMFGIRYDFKKPAPKSK